MSPFPAVAIFGFPVATFDYIWHSQLHLNQEPLRSQLYIISISHGQDSTEESIEGAIVLIYLAFFFHFGRWQGG
ncbi:hypothetical protein AKJ58_01400 [candidate division MSBL1 archaeon SCGC-AAA385D11]|uniref:Uncharacterized protein n=1 Tax=candidate division MSBL1 archaeon SCGC-AAA385D11 TaxID=1698286 RepID=A0A133VNC4_9EURY|nr:hypothetical protein AKJ58_01400 [candidate division MSBL1 archaeon SCGC-AAA385D11]